MQKLAIWTCLCLLSLSAQAWDSDGHRIIASIAMDHLSACSSTQVQGLLKQAENNLPGAKISNLVIAADWLDHDHSQCAQYAALYCFPPPKSWHFIDSPYVLSGEPRTWPVKPPNVVWALSNAIETLSSPSSSTEAKAQSLLIIDHLAGDITQPLHNIEAYDASHFPHGDRGGNAYLITYTPHCAMTYPVDNLHTLWDQGAGLFSCFNGQKQFIKSTAQRLEQTYATNASFKALVDTAQSQSANDVAAWSKQAAAYAPQVYQVPYNGSPSASYINWAQGIVNQQIMLGGLRLATILNQAFVANGMCSAQ